MDFEHRWWTYHDFDEALTCRPTDSKQWDALFMDTAFAVSKLSKCSSRKIGAVLVKDRRIIATGFNGSPMGSRLCQGASFCPRKKLGYASGEGLSLCPAVHGETNCINNAARHGVATEGATIYINLMPCHACAGNLINAGIVEIVYFGSIYSHDDLTRLKLADANVILRPIHPTYEVSK